MFEFEYTNELCGKELGLITNFITKELTVIRKNRRNLVKFAYSECLKGKIIFLDYQRIINEVQRMSVEIDFLEYKRQQYNKLKEKKIK